MGEAHSDVVRQVGKVLVERTKGPDHLTWYSAWEPADGRYGEVRMIDGGAFGRVDTKQHPDPETLPGNPADRVGAMTSWEESQRERAYLLIGRAFRESSEGLRSRGRVHFIGDPEKTLEQMQAKRGKRSEPDSKREHAPTFAGGGGGD